MIDVESALEDLPHFNAFCSVAELHALVESIRADSRFHIEVAGTSVAGAPIHHLRFGSGSVKALFVGFPHCKEPICGLTVFSLLTLLRKGHRSLSEADVEWHIVPCIDPDGARLNEAWSLKPFTLENYMRNFYVQSPRDQVDMSFPVRHKKLHWNQPSKEARVLQGIMDKVLPDFFFSLHNAWTGGAFYHLSRDIGPKYYGKLYELLKQQNFPLQTRPMWKEVCPQYAAGVVQFWSIKRHYDHLERTMLSPEKLLSFGAASWDYLDEIKPGAVTFATELGYVRHPKDESEKDTGLDLRKFKLRVDADSKFLATVLLEEWEKVKGELDPQSLLYRAAIGGGALPSKDTLNEGGRPLSMHPTRDILFNPQHNKTMTEGDLFQAIMVDGGFWGLCQTYQVVRLLKASPQTPAVQQAIGRLEAAYNDALVEINRYVDFSAAKVTDHDTLAKVQLGSGLVVLNAILEEKGRCKQQ